MNTIRVRLNNQDGTGVAEKDFDTAEIAGACLIQHKGLNYCYSHIAGDCIVFVQAGHIIEFGI